MGGTTVVDHVAQDGSNSVAITCDGDVERIIADDDHSPCSLKGDDDLVHELGNSACLPGCILYCRSSKSTGTSLAPTATAGRCNGTRTHENIERLLASRN